MLIFLFFLYKENDVVYHWTDIIIFWRNISLDIYVKRPKFLKNFSYIFINTHFCMKMPYFIFIKKYDEIFEMI